MVDFSGGSYNIHQGAVYAPKHRIRRRNFVLAKSQQILTIGFVEHLFILSHETQLLFPLQHPDG